MTFEAMFKLPRRVFAPNASLSRRRRATAECRGREIASMLFFGSMR
jgi:hypothetical protein